MPFNMPCDHLPAPFFWLFASLSGECSAIGVFATLIVTEYPLPRHVHSADVGGFSMLGLGYRGAPIQVGEPMETTSWYEGFQNAIV